MHKSKLHVVSLALNSLFILTKSCLQQWKDMPTFNKIVLILLQLLIFAHVCSLFPGAGVWDGDKGHCFQFRWSLTLAYIILTHHCLSKHS